MNEKANSITLERRDIFDVMAAYMGQSVLHPGGFNATDMLLAQCSLSSDSRVLDIACGKGTTSIYIAKKYGCSVVGIDISQELIEQGRELVRRQRVENLVTLQVGDACSLPYDDSEFDCAISQSVLILVPVKETAVAEALRVVKSGGKAGWIELSWKKNPTQELLDTISNIISEPWMINIMTFEQWEKLFGKAKHKNFMAFRASVEFQGMKGMVYDEGFVNSLKIMSKFELDERVKKRVDMLDDFFNQYAGYFGYGIYILNM